LAGANVTLDISQTTSGTSVSGLAGLPNTFVSLGGKTLTITNGAVPFAGVIQDGGMAAARVARWSSPPRAART
jgi:hypothetical protein